MVEFGEGARGQGPSVERNGCEVFVHDEAIVEVGLRCAQGEGGVGTKAAVGLDGA